MCASVMTAVTVIIHVTVINNIIINIYVNIIIIDMLIRHRSDSVIYGQQ